jgi:FAD/FMN-containing dehydrogenase
VTKGSWGRLPFPGAARTLSRDWRFEDLPQVTAPDSLLAYGRGRSYGDSCLNSGASALGTDSLRRFIRLDSAGVLHCEAGVTLDEMLQLVVPKGWFLPTLPGTRFVTLGGAIANDVHGKNHHVAGSFGCHVLSLGLLRSNGSRLDCSPHAHPELFAATVGGLGLTGLVTDARIQLIPISSDAMEVEDICFSSLQEFTRLSRDSGDWDYTVSWIDTFERRGHTLRGIFSRARHAAQPGQLQPGPSRPGLTVPFVPPLSLVNSLTVNLFNRAYYTAGRRRERRGRRLTHFQPYFFPLDSIDHWNRIYGGKGFYQYQCVVPEEDGEAAIGRLLRQIFASRQGSFLAVLKAFGDRVSPGMLSFPRSGLTLALDFPNRGEETLRLLASFDNIVRDCGGALYPAKDARMPPDMFARSFPRLDEFREHIDPAFSSAFWRRVNQ